MRGEKAVRIERGEHLPLEDDYGEESNPYDVPELDE